MGFALSIGKGLKNNASPYQTVMVFGAPLNQPDASGWGALPSIVGPTASFDLSAITINHEVVVALLNASGVAEGEYTVTIRWLKLPEYEEIFSFDWGWYADRGSWFYVYSYIGWLDWEINRDGQYQVEVRVEGPQLYVASRQFSVTGIAPEEPPEEEPPEEPEPDVSWQEAILYMMFQVAGFFNDAADEVQGWIWPFNYLAGPFRWVHDTIFHGTLHVGNFFAFIRDLAELIGEGLSWDDLWALIISYVPWLGEVGEWFANRWAWFWSAVSEWWDTVTDTVKGWISAAIQWFDDVAAGWWDFWNNLWPGITAWWDSMAAGWDNFTRVTLPSLAFWDDIESWFDARFEDMADFWDGWQEVRDQVFDFFRNPIDFIWDKFVDWFLGPEE